MSTRISAPRPLVIGHRGACGYVPEHTLTSYFIAMQAGADYVEPDLVMTRDGVLVARHENEIGGTTDVAEHAEFVNRRATRVIDGVSMTGWFTEDFTLAELKTLRARERIPDVRPGNTRFNGQFEVPTLEEILELLAAVQQQREAAARQRGLPAPARIGIYPETKHPSYFAGLGLAMEEQLVGALHRYGYQGPDGGAHIQCFEVSNLKAMRQMTQLPIVQLIDSEGAPYDFVMRGDKRTYADMVTPAGLKEIATYADAIGPYKLMILTRDPQDGSGPATSLITDAHARNLRVHAWTFRAENQYLPREDRTGGELGNLRAELFRFLDAGLDGFFTDHPDLGVAARDAWLRERQ